MKLKIFQLKNSRLVVFSLVLLNLNVCIAQTKESKLDFSGYDKSCGIEITLVDEFLKVVWPYNSKKAYMTFRLTPDLGGKSRIPQKPLIKDIGVIEEGIPFNILEDLNPEYAIFLGERDLEKRAGWQVFFDYPYQRSYNIQKAILNIQNVKIISTGQRATVSLIGLNAGEFQGSLDFTFYKGTPMVHMEAALKTQQNGRAYLYHSGLSTLTDQIKNVSWESVEDELVTIPAEGEFATPKRTRFRTIIAKSEKGSIAAFCAPHQFSPPLDGVGNYGYNWSGQNYLDLFNGYGWGVRQPIFGDRRQVPWLNAPPNSVQKMGMFFYFDNKVPDVVLNEIKKFTHGDRFTDIPGYKKFTSHYHVEHSLDFINKQKEQGTDGIPEGLEKPEFIQFFKKMGVDIVHLGEFHNGRTPKLKTEERLKQLQVMHNECARLSSENFLLLPGEEPNIELGGHWMSFFPKPINWVLNNSSEKPFMENTKEYGKVYHIGSSEDVLKLFKKEKGLMWVAHARIKGSTGYPDKYKEEAFFKSDNYLGAAWKHMPSDLSDDNMGTRVLDLLDDMANWGTRKQVIGEVDVFDIQNDYELYGAMSINYLKLNELPKYEEGWQPIIDVLKSGNFIVSTGEIVLKSFDINGQECGSTLKRTKGQQTVLNTEIDWTFPLSYMEVISGDGKQVYRKRIDLNETTAFGSKQFEIDLELNQVDWVRFEVWDIAKNGTFTQPIWISK